MPLNAVEVSKMCQRTKLVKHTDKMDHVLPGISPGWFVETWKASWGLHDIKEVTYNVLKQPVNAKKLHVHNNDFSLLLPKGQANTWLTETYSLDDSKIKVSCLHEDNLVLLTYKTNEKVKSFMDLESEQVNYFQFSSELTQTFDERLGWSKFVLLKTNITDVEVGAYDMKTNNEFDYAIPLFRKDDGFAKCFAQFNLKHANTGDIIAFHYHEHQTDQWFFFQGEALVVLIDKRSKSPTRNEKMIIKVSDKMPMIISIPPGVLHGYKVLRGPCKLFYGVDQEYNPKKPDEINRDYNDPYLGFDWEKMQFENKTWF